MLTTRSEKLIQQAQKVIPGGVNSPVRAFKSVGKTPLFIKRGHGAYIFDEDNNKYTDYVLSWGPLVLGHAYPSVIEAICSQAKNGTSFGAPTNNEILLAEKIVNLFPSVDMVRFVSSGTEATMSAIRLARAFTGKDKIIKFSGGFHGHADMLLAQAGSGVATLSLPDSAGVPKAATFDTLVAPYNDLNTVAKFFADSPGQIAGIIVEPIASNMGFVLPKPEFLPGLKNLCEQNGALLILDEVMTGFRAAFPGLQSYFNLTPDITCLGKVIGGGLPIAAYGARKEIMEKVAPLGPMYQSGTLSGNPLCTIAGLTTLNVLESAEIFPSIVAKTTRLISGLIEQANKNNIRVQAASFGTMFGFYLLNNSAPEIATPITNYDEAQRYIHVQRYSHFFHEMLSQGQYFAPSAFEAGFMSNAHTHTDIDETIVAIGNAFKKIG